MTIEEKIFKCASVNFEKLVSYGFKKQQDKYVIEKTFMDDAFKAVVTVDKTGYVRGVVYDVAADDVYMPLRVEEMVAGFAGLVRAGYENILEDIKARCCEPCYFSGAQANRLAENIRQRYGDAPFFPWDKYDGYGVFKNPQNDKWYALFMNIDKGKLNLKQSGAVDVVNIKLDADEIQKLLKRNGFFPAYHMNKKSWITLVLNETIEDDEILNLIDESHAFTLDKPANYKGTGRAWLVPANPKFFDIVGAFQKNDELTWKQSANYKVGDIIFMYVGAPVSAVLYKCAVIKTDMPYRYHDKNLKISKVMMIKRLKTFEPKLMTFVKLAEFGVRAVRGPRSCPDAVVKWLESNG